MKTDLSMYVRGTGDVRRVYMVDDRVGCWAVTVHRSSGEWQLPEADAMSISQWIGHYRLDLTPDQRRQRIADVRHDIVERVAAVC